MFTPRRMVKSANNIDKHKQTWIGQQPRLHDGGRKKEERGVKES